MKGTTFVSLCLQAITTVQKHLHETGSMLVGLILQAASIISLMIRFIDHCIDEIRLSIICHGDISVITWGWKDTEATPYANFEVEHECRNWESILEWTKAHQANQSAIVRPA